MVKGIYTIIKKDKASLARDILNHDITEYTIQRVMSMYGFDFYDGDTLEEVISDGVLFIEEINKDNATSTFLKIFNNDDAANDYSEDFSVHVTPEQFLEALDEPLEI